MRTVELRHNIAEVFILKDARHTGSGLSSSYEATNVMGTLH